MLDSDEKKMCLCKSCEEPPKSKCTYTYKNIFGVRIQGPCQFTILVTEDSEITMQVRKDWERLERYVKTESKLELKMAELK